MRLTITDDGRYQTDNELDAFNFIDDEIHRGMVQVCSGGQWESVCYSELWGSEDATAACRQLEFSPFGERVNSFVITLVSY